MAKVTHISDNNERDRHLVKLVLSGHDWAFSQLVKDTEGLVAQIIFKLVSNDSDRSDLAQDVYLKVFAKLDGFKFQSKLSTWIAQITYNTCLSYIERKKLVLLGDQYSVEDNDRSSGADALIHSDLEADTHVYTKQRSDILACELEKLPPLFKTLIVLFHQEQMSYGEIGTITGLPAGTLKSYLFRARKMLKTNLLQKYKQDEI